MSKPEKIKSVKLKELTKHEKIMARIVENNPAPKLKEKDKGTIKSHKTLTGLRK